MAIKVGINGFGRIGRNVIRTAQSDSQIEFVTVNDLTSSTTLAYMMKKNPVAASLKSDARLKRPVKKGRRVPPSDGKDSVFLVIFFVVLATVILSLVIACSVALYTGSPVLLNEVTETALWVFKDGFLLILGLLLHLLLSRLARE